MIKQITIIGLGLIGSSIARAIKASNYCQILIGFDQDAATTNKAQQLGIIDKGATQYAEAVQYSDLIILAVPINAFDITLMRIKSAIKATAIITDVCSVKSKVMQQAKEILGNKMAQFVPGHPIAGSEKSGVDAGQTDLFKNRLVILTPDKKTNATALANVQSLWQALGAKVKLLTSHEHDNLLAVTSHVPQALAFAFMSYIYKNPNYPQILAYAGNGFKDFTRIAASNPELWKDIVLANASSMLIELQHFKKELLNLQAAIENCDDQLLLEIFTRAQQARNFYENLLNSLNP